MLSSNNQMVLKNLVSFIYNLVILGGQPRAKQAPIYEVIASDVLERAKKGASNSPATRSYLAEGGDGELCCICLSKLKEGEDMRVLPCLHEFHRACINKWFNACTKTCPVCRFSMDEKEKFHFGEELTDDMLIWFSSFHVAGF